jgi:hypothetical protein
MVATRQQQRGMGLLTWLVVLAVFGIFTLVGVKSMPVYMNHFKVASIMKWAASQPNFESANPVEIQKGIDRRFDVDMVKHIVAKDVKVVTDKKGKQIMVKYEVRVPMIYNIDFVYKFDEAMSMRQH